MQYTYLNALYDIIFLYLQLATCQTLHRLSSKQNKTHEYKATVISGSKAYDGDNIQSFLSPVHCNQDICIYNLLLSAQVSSSMTKASISLEAKK